MKTTRSRTTLLLRLGAALAGAAALGVLYLLRDPLPRFMDRRSSIESIVAGEMTAEGESVIQPVRIRAASGLEVNLAVRRHRSDTTREPLPLVIILGGHVTGAEAVRVVGDVPGVILAALAYPFDGDHRPSTLTFLRQIPRIRGAIHDTPPAIMIALDYLLTVPGVDTTRVEGVGVSLGAPFMTIAGALDSRLTRVWSIHGSGGHYVPLEANLRKAIPFEPLRAVAAMKASVIIGGPRLAPDRWAGRISPRPFIMVNARDDERMPRAAVEQLYAAAGHPKEIIWMPGGHVHPGTPVVQQLLEIVLARVRAGDELRLQ